MRNGQITNWATMGGIARTKAAVALASLATLLLSCTESPPCPNTSCAFPPLTLELEARPWVPGEYVVSITDSGRTYECRFEIGADGANGQAGSAGDDDASEVVHGCDQVSGDSGETWDAPEWLEGDNGTITFWIKRPTEQLPLSIRVDGRTLLEEELTPTYTKSATGRPECGGCVSATETVTLPAEEP